MIANKTIKLKIGLIFVISISFIFLLTKFTYATESNEKITLTTTVQNVSNDISNTFTYKIEPSIENQNDGITSPITFDVNFNQVTPNEKKEAIVNSEFDFSQIKFTQTGIYKYVITQIASSDKDTFPVSNQKYEIDVQVILDETNRTIVKYISSQAIDLSTNEKTNLKFINTPIYTYINVENYVTGKVPTDEYFKYKIVVDGNIGDKYEIYGQDDVIIYENQKINTSNEYIVKAGEDNYIYVYLKDNQKITIGLTEDNTNQIKIGTKYKITKIGARKWNTYINDEETKDIDFLTTGENGLNNKIVIVNQRDFDVAVTGVFINILPYILLIVAGVVGVILINKTKKNDDAND